MGVSACGGMTSFPASLDRVKGVVRSRSYRPRRTAPARAVSRSRMSALDMSPLRSADMSDLDRVVSARRVIDRVGRRRRARRLSLSDMSPLRSGDMSRLDRGDATYSSAAWIRRRFAGMRTSSSRWAPTCSPDRSSRSPPTPRPHGSCSSSPRAPTSAARSSSTRGTSTRPSSGRAWSTRATRHARVHPAVVHRPARGARREHAARITLAPVVPPGALDGIPPERAGKDTLPFLPNVFEVINARTTNWHISPWPSPDWARVVHPELDEEAAVARLWDELVYLMRLDAADPAEAWRTRIRELNEAGRRLDELRLDALRFVGPGNRPHRRSPAHVALRGRAWRCGDRRRRLLRTEPADGGDQRDRRTRRVSTVSSPRRSRSTSSAPSSAGLRVRFEGGRAVEIEADENAEVLRARAQVDDGASRLGEVALVDRERRIGRTGKSSSTRSWTRTRRATSPSATPMRPASTRRTCRGSTRARSTSTS